MIKPHWTLRNIKNLCLKTSLTNINWFSTKFFLEKKIYLHLFAFHRSVFINLLDRGWFRFSTLVRLYSSALRSANEESAGDLRLDNLLLHKPCLSRHRTALHGSFYKDPHRQQRRRCVSGVFRCSGRILRRPALLSQQINGAQEGKDRREGIRRVHAHRQP